MALCSTPSVGSPSASWTACLWQGEQAWSACSHGVLAIVSAARSRLIYFGATDQRLNLLNAPEGTPAPDAETVSPNWGGHRFWLGPQKRWVWPAPAEWEHAAAASVSIQGDTLIVRHARVRADYPALTRSYAWEGKRLRCSVSWQDDGRPYFGMHVIAVDAPFETTASRLCWEEVPDGVVDVQMLAPKGSGLLPHPGLEAKTDQVTVRSGRGVAKAGFVPQTLSTARAQGWTLLVHPGPHEGTAITSPDFGYLSQVWVGGPEVPLAELEQLTPYLTGGADGRCASTLFLEARQA